MGTYEQAIARLRHEREEFSAQIEVLRKRRHLVNVELLALEQAITPPKVKAKAKPGDVIMTVEESSAVVMKGAEHEG